MGRNITLDYFKLFLSLLIIAAHTTLYQNGLLGWIFSNGFGRVGVPCFFVINGYFLLPVLKEWTKVKKYLLHLLILYFVWSFIYIPIGIYEFKSLKLYFFNVFTTGFWHLWYLNALFFGVIMLYFLRNVRPSILLTLSFILFFAGYILQRLYLIDMNIVENEQVRNFFFMGFPFIYIGYYIHQRKLEEKLKARKNFLLLSVLFFMIIMLAELIAIYILRGNDRQYNDDFYFAFIFLCPLSVMYILSVSKYKDADGYISKLSTSVYLTHIIAIYFVRLVFGIGDLFSFPIIIFFSLLFGHCVLELNKKFKIFI